MKTVMLMLMLLFVLSAGFAADDSNAPKPGDAVRFRLGDGETVQGKLAGADPYGVRVEIARDVVIRYDKSKLSPDALALFYPDASPAPRAERPKSAPAAPPAKPAGEPAAKKGSRQWHANLGEAQKLAAQNKVPVFLLFSSPDASEPCKIMDERVFSNPQFLDYAERGLVLVRLDYPKDASKSDPAARYNETQARIYRIKGYPTLILIGSNGRLIWREDGGYRCSARQFIEILEKAKKGKQEQAK